MYLFLVLIMEFSLYGIVSTLLNGFLACDLNTTDQSDIDLKFPVLWEIHRHMLRFFGMMDVRVGRHGCDYRGTCRGFDPRTEQIFV